MTLFCPKCFGDAGLRRRIEEIRPSQPNEKCSFHPRNKGVPAEEVSAIVDQVFRSHYSIGEPGWNGQEGEPLDWVISNLVESESDEINQALIDQLIEDDDYWPPDGGEPFYAEDQNYATWRPAEGRVSALWQNFRESIVHRQRFFNTDATRLIEEIFGGIHLQIDQDKNSAVYQLNPGDRHSSIYRARIANNSDEVATFRESPVKNLSPPPERLRRPGRMNAAGVACFYGAFDLSTCVAELRPVVGSLVVGARFELVRPIYVLDTTRFQRPMKQISWFVKDQIRRAEQWEFMQSFMHEMSKPISPADEHIDYVPTQAVAEYFAHRHEFKRSGISARIEAIIYKSAQNPKGCNIVLLADAAHIVSEVAITPTKKRSPILTEFLPNSMASFLGNRRDPQPSLKLDETSLQTLVVHGAHYDASEYEDWIDVS